MANKFNKKNQIQMRPKVCKVHPPPPPESFCEVLPDPFTGGAFQFVEISYRAGVLGFPNTQEIIILNTDQVLAMSEDTIDNDSNFHLLRNRIIVGQGTYRTFASFTINGNEECLAPFTLIVT